MSTRAAHLRRRPRVQRARMKPRRMVRAQRGSSTSGSAQASEKHEQLPYVLPSVGGVAEGPKSRGREPHPPRQAPNDRSVGARHVSLATAPDTGAGWCVQSTGFARSGVDAHRDFLLEPRPMRRNLGESGKSSSCRDQYSVRRSGQLGRPDPNVRAPKERPHAAGEGSS
jgi:hypothetical protein